MRDLDITLDHEFAVVTAGQGASRQVLPRCASNGPCTHWMEGSSGWEAELRFVGDGDSPNRGAEALGDTRLVGDLGQGGGALGTVRVTGSSPEAMIYRFVGHTPNLSVNELAVDSVHRLLLVAPRHRPEFVEVEPTAWRAIAGAWTANVEVALDPQN